MMPNFLKFLLLVSIFVPIMVFVGVKSHNEVVALELNGVVKNINWESRNHKMPSIQVESQNEIKLFESNRITLNSTDLKVGDRIVKKSDSKTCHINGVPKICIN